MTQALSADVRSALKSLNALQQVSRLLEWDQQVMMPAAANAGRVEQMAAIAAEIHRRQTDRKWFETLEAHPTPSDPVDAAHLRLARRECNRARRIPAALADALTRETGAALPVWAEARQSKNFAAYSPTLERIVELKGQEAAALGYEDSPYDPLLDEFEPGTKTRTVAALFARLGPKLQDLLDKVMGSKAEAPKLPGQLDAEAQLSFSRDISAALGYRFDSGRLDLTLHPFCSGISSPSDVRICTRIDPGNFDECLFSSIHEVGHALYEQGLPETLSGLPAGAAVSLGVHESQSRLWENQVARGRAFSRWILEQAKIAFPSFTPISHDNFYHAINRVEACPIRTSADEVAYNLHIILRFELENALLRGDLLVADLEGAWNEGMKRWLHITPKDAGEGVLQDVHWAAGSFGYFPTYTLGNVYSACLFAAAKRAIPELENSLADGRALALLGWLRENVHTAASTLSATELMEKACGASVDEQPLVAYLEGKYLELYPS